VRALLIDQARDRAGVVAVRDLARAGFTVGTGAPYQSFASYSRYAKRHHIVHECSENEDRFIADVAAAVAQERYEIVFCSYETGLMALSRRREEIAPAIWPYPELAVVERAFDKLELFHAAQAAGCHTPFTEPASEQALARWNGAVVVKARNHVPHRFDTAMFESPAAARQLVDQLLEEGGEPLLQTPLRGTMGAVVVVVGADGEVIAEVHQEAVRTWPPEAGDTVLGRVVANDLQLSQQVRALVAELGWFGLAQIEFFRDEHQRAWITDFNGRFYGSMALASRAGVNVAALWALSALGRPVQAGSARVGARFQWLNRDLAAGYSTGPRGLLDAIAAAPIAAHSMWDPRDPSPVVRYLLPESARRLRARVFGER
jgi:predicted ATP-grasp superfamily ATP-dependent carboligase